MGSGEYSAPVSGDSEQTDGAGGWSADEAREYLEFALRDDLMRFAAVYGWDAVDAQVQAARQGDV